MAQKNAIFNKLKMRLDSEAVSKTGISVYFHNHPLRFHAYRDHFVNAFTFRVNRIEIFMLDDAITDSI